VQQPVTTGTTAEQPVTAPVHQPVTSGTTAVTPGQPVTSGNAVPTQTGATRSGATAATELPFTGTHTNTLLALSALLILSGCGLLLVARPTA
jgi:LPXTG-motif cell wall-anchored protein